MVSTLRFASTPFSNTVSAVRDLSLTPVFIFTETGAVAAPFDFELSFTSFVFLLVDAIVGLVLIGCVAVFAILVLAFVMAYGQRRG